MGVPAPASPVTKRYLQGSGGGSSGSGGYGGNYGPSYNTYNSGGGSSCEGEGCIATIIIVVIFSIVAAVLYLMSKKSEVTRNKDMSSVPTENDFLAGKTSAYGTAETVSRTPECGPPCFPPGRYTGTYRQYNNVHSMEPFQLRYTETTSSSGEYQVRGEGSDSVGDYYLTGKWIGGRLALTKNYKLGTGDTRENKGHKVYLRLEKDGDCMTGVYYVRTSQYSGQDQFKIWCLDAVIPATMGPVVEAVPIPVAFATVVPSEEEIVVSAPPDETKTGEDKTPVPTAPSAPPTEEEYDIGPGIYARPTRLSAQAIAYHSDRIFVEPFRNRLSREIKQEMEVDIVMTKRTEDELIDIRLKGSDVQPTVTGLPTHGVLAKEIKIGDKIVSVNGQTIVNGVIDAFAKLNNAAVGNVHLTVVRLVVSEQSK